MKGYSIDSEDSPVLKMLEIHITGNVVPNAWYGNIRRLVKGKGKLAGKSFNIPYFEAITVLSEIVYWYRPIDVRDEDRGEFTGYYKKFKADKLQISVKVLSEKFGLSEDAIRHALKYLEKDLGAITREYRNVRSEESGYNLKVQYVEIVPAVLFRITTKLRTHESGDVAGRSQLIPGRGDTTNTTTNTTTKRKVSKSIRNNITDVAEKHQPTLPGIETNGRDPMLYDMAMALSEAMVKDFQLDRSKLFGWAKKLRKAGYTGEQVLRCYTGEDSAWRKHTSWRKDYRPPRWDESLGTIKQFAEQPTDDLQNAW